MQHWHLLVALRNSSFLHRLHTHVCIVALFLFSLRDFVNGTSYVQFRCIRPVNEKLPKSYSCTSISWSFVLGHAELRETRVRFIRIIGKLIFCTYTNRYGSLKINVAQFNKSNLSWQAFLYFNKTYSLMLYCVEVLNSFNIMGKYELYRQMIWRSQLVHNSDRFNLFKCPEYSIIFFFCVDIYSWITIVNSFCSTFLSHTKSMTDIFWGQK